MKKETKEKNEKLAVLIQVTTAGEEQDGRSSNTFRDRRTTEIKLKRSSATEMMDELEAVIDRYLNFTEYQKADLPANEHGTIPNFVPSCSEITQTDESLAIERDAAGHPLE